MEQVLTSFFTQLLAFFLAYVGGTYVKFHMQRWRRREVGKEENDIQLARDVLSLLSRTRLDKITDEIYMGRTTFRDLDRLERFVNLQRMEEFSDPEVNSCFAACGEAMKELLDFCRPHFDPVSIDLDRLRFHRPNDAEGGDEKYDRLLELRKRLVFDMDEKYLTFCRRVSTHLPAARSKSISRTRSNGRSASEHRGKRS